MEVNHLFIIKKKKNISMNYGKTTMWRLAILFIMSTVTFAACSTLKAEAPTSKASAPKPSSKGEEGLM